jgi:hypothetical protein
VKRHVLLDVRKGEPLGCGCGESFANIHEAATHFERIKDAEDFRQPSDVTSQNPKWWNIIQRIRRNLRKMNW